jgi:hypothetical protein
LHEVFGLPAGTTILPRGPLPLALNPATNNLTAPARFLRHPLVQNRYFFTLPRSLWDDVYRRIGEHAFDDDAVQLEDCLASLCGDHSTNAGLFRGRAFPYHHFHRAPSYRVSAAEMGWEINQAKLDRQLRLLDDRANGLARTARGYLGWLLTNPRFLDEHDTLLNSEARIIERWAMENFGMPTPPVGFGTATRAEKSQFTAANPRFVEFYCRWRLQKLAAPYLPVPLQPLLAGRLPEAILARYLQTGGLFVVPDTFPVPSRDEFRGMLDNALHGSPPEHLAEWMTIIAGNNTAKQAILRFARVFELQHFWRVLHHRHRSVLRRQTTMLKRVFALFLQTGERSIHQDLIEIRRRLGANWIERGASYSLGPF